MLTFSFGATFLFLIPWLKIIFFFSNHFLFLRSRFLFLFSKKKEIIIIVIYIYIIIYIIIIIKRDENRRGEKKTHWREKKSGGDKKIAVARGKSQKEKFFKDFFNIKKAVSAWLTAFWIMKKSLFLSFCCSFWSPFIAEHSTSCMCSVSTKSGIVLSTAKAIHLVLQAGTHIEAVTGVFYFHLCLVKFAYVFCCQIFAIYTAIYKSDSHNSSFLVLLYLVVVFWVQNYSKFSLETN